MGRRGRAAHSRDPHPRSGWPTHVRIITTAEVLLKERGVWAPYWAPQPRDPAPGRQAPSPQNVWLWRPAGINFRSPRGLGEIEIPLLKGAHKISHTPGTRAEAVIWKEPKSDSSVDLGESAKEAASNWSSPWRHRHWQAPFWNPPSSWLAPGPSLTHQPVHTSTGTPQAKQLAGQPSADRLP